MKKQKQGALNAAMINRAMGRTDAAIIADLSEVASRLSPENLSCDGELSVGQQRATYNVLMDQWDALVRELGRTPKVCEIADCLGGTEYGEQLCTDPGMAA